MDTEDVQWMNRFNQGKKDLSMTDKESTFYANAATRVCMLKKKMELESQNKRIIVIAPKKEISMLKNICKATLMNGKTCTKKSDCGDFCRRHKLVIN